MSWTKTGSVLVAAGPWSAWDIDAHGHLGTDGVTAVVCKTITPAPRALAADAGLWGSVASPINRMGLANPGLAALKAIAGEVGVRRPPWAARGVQTIQSIAALSREDVRDWVALARAIAALSFVDALELNISCPNVAMSAPRTLATVVRRVSAAVSIPVIVKLPPDPWRVGEMAATAERAGAAAICATNTLPASATADDYEAVDGVSLRDGGLSGAALRPVALRCVQEVAQRVSIPIIGCGGIEDVDDVRAFIAAGATSVAVGSAHITDRHAASRIAQRMSQPGRRSTGIESAESRILARTGGRRVGLCIGIDPDPAQHVAAATSGPHNLRAIERHFTDVLDATAHLAAAVKPNLSMFERFGAEGWRLLERILGRLPDDVPVIIDGKRGDVASTARHAAAACFGHLNADAATVNPYLGPDSLQPFLEWPNRLIFLVCATSNPGASHFQAIIDSEGTALSTHVARLAAELDRTDMVDGEQPTRVGLVAGATEPRAIAEVRAAAPNAWLLVPGIGAQGGDLRASLRVATFGMTQHAGVLVNASRSVTYAAVGNDAAARARNEAERLTRDIDTYNEITIAAV